MEEVEEVEEGLRAALIKGVKGRLQPINLLIAPKALTIQASEVLISGETHPLRQFKDWATLKKCLRLYRASSRHEVTKITTTTINTMI